MSKKEREFMGNNNHAQIAVYILIPDVLVIQGRNPQRHHHRT